MIFFGIAWVIWGTVTPAISDRIGRKATIVPGMALAALGLSDTMKVTYGKSPRVAAMVRTSRGVATL